MSLARGREERSRLTGRSVRTVKEVIGIANAHRYDRLTTVVRVNPKPSRVKKETRIRKEDKHTGCQGHIADMGGYGVEVKRRWVCW